MEIKNFKELITNNEEVREFFSELRKIQNETRPEFEKNTLSYMHYMQSKGGRTTSLIKRIKRDCALIILNDLKINNIEYFENFTALAYQLFCKKLLGFSVAKKDILMLVNKEKNGRLDDSGKKVAEFVNDFYGKHFKNCDYKNKLNAFIVYKKRR